MRKNFAWLFCLAAVGLSVLGASAEVLAAGGLHEAAEAVGKEMGALWVVPFAGLLLSIAVMPLTIPHFWHHNYGKVAAFWGAAFIIPYALVYGFSLALYNVLHVLFLEYISFIILLF